MEIIKNGDLSKLKETRTFECSRCGCVFKANKDEYSHGIEYCEHYYHCKCPTCGKDSYEQDSRMFSENNSKKGNYV